jgi:hypothetical protein
LEGGCAVIHISRVPGFGMPRGPTQQCAKDVEDVAKAHELLRNRDITACGDFLESPSNAVRDGHCFGRDTQGGA